MNTYKGFNIGDWVERINCNNGGGMAIGDIGQIVKFVEYKEGKPEKKGPGCYAVLLGKPTLLHDIANLKHVPNPKLNEKSLNLEVELRSTIQSVVKKLRGDK